MSVNVRALVRHPCLISDRIAGLLCTENVGAAGCSVQRRAETCYLHSFQRWDACNSSAQPSGSAYVTNECTLWDFLPLWLKVDHVKLMRPAAVRMCGRLGFCWDPCSISAMLLLLLFCFKRVSIHHRQTDSWQPHGPNAKKKKKISYILVYSWQKNNLIRNMASISLLNNFSSSNDWQLILSV